MTRQRKILLSTNCYCRRNRLRRLIVAALMVSTHKHLVKPHCLSVQHVHTAMPMYGKRRGMDSVAWLEK